MNYSRIDIEKDVLSRHLHPNDFRFMDVETPNPFLLCAARTNNKKLYTLRIELSRFPYDVPEVYVTQMLKTKTGEDMNGWSVSMHTCGSKNGWTRIGHCHHDDWWPNHSLLLVYFKCLIWLNIYELHLQTGETMDTYLKYAHEKLTLNNDVTINAGDNSLQNIGNVMRIAQYGEEETLEYGLEFDPVEFMLKPIHISESVNFPVLALREGYD